MSDPEHRGWYSRDYLPHRDTPGLLQGLTIHLADSMPQAVLARWLAELAHLDQRERDIEKRRRIAAWLDAGHGSCWLRRPDIATAIENALLFFDGQRYRLIAWVVMPNHVHFLAEMNDGFPLGELLYSMKSFTAKEANKLLGTSGQFWARAYHDRFIRDANHFDNVVRYIEQNPVKARLCAKAEDWPWSSARRKPGAPGAPPLGAPPSSCGF